MALNLYSYKIMRDKALFIQKTLKNGITTKTEKRHSVIDDDVQNGEKEF